MAKPATKSAVADLGKKMVAEAKSVFSSAGVANAGSRVFTEDTPYDIFPHAIVIFPDEGRSQQTETKGEAPVVCFPQVNIYDKGNGWKDVTDYTDSLIQSVTAPAFSVSGWSVHFNRLQFNQRNSTSTVDEETVFSRSAQFQIHLQSN